MYSRNDLLGAFSVHRQRRQRDFNAHEMALFQWFACHAANSMEHLSLQRQQDQKRHRGVLVISREGQIQAMNLEAQRILESLPDKEAQLLPGPADSSLIWRCGGEVFVVRTRRVDPASIVGLDDASQVAPSATLDRLAQRLRVAESEQRHQFAVTFEKLDVHDEVRSEIFGMHLSPQQKRVAILLLKRYEPRQIAAILALSPHTVREYVKGICHRAGVNGYKELISKLSDGNGTAQ